MDKSLINMEVSMAKFYSYSDKSKVSKDDLLIVLLMCESGKYIGLADKGEFYAIKNINRIPDLNISEHDFIACTKVNMGEYLIPIGYSNEDEWILQEFDIGSN